MLEYPSSIFHSEHSEVIILSGGKVTIYDNLPIPMIDYKTTNKSTDGSELFKDISGKNIRMIRTESNTIPHKIFDNIKLPIQDYVLNICKFAPDNMKELVTGDIPYPMYIDIETRTVEDNFPRADKDDIISIQIKFPDTDPIILMQEPGDDKDVQLLNKFGDLCIVSPTGKVPEFTVGYFHTRFDNLYIVDRLDHNNMLMQWRQRVTDGRYPRLKGNHLYTASWMTSSDMKRKKKLKDARREIYELVPGFYSIDIYDITKLDFALKYLPNKRMKTVAEFFNCPFIYDIPIEEKTNMNDLIENNRERFIKYAISDILITEFLYKLYESKIIASANLLQVPLTMASRLTSGQKAYLIVLREMLKNKYYSTQKNVDRHSNLYDRSEKYQGALVECRHRGYFPRITYLDATSMYPNIIHDFNLSYDTLKYKGIIEYRDWDRPKEITIEPIDNQWTRVFIPDNNYRCMLEFENNFVVDGFMRKTINSMLQTRTKYKNMANDYKNRYKISKNEEDNINSILYSSREAETKVSINSIYGLFGNKYYEVGDLPIAVYTTAIGRWIMTEMTNYFGESVLEVDTDGLILNRDKLPTEDIDLTNTYLIDKLHTKFGIPMDKINFNLKFEDNGSIYIHQMKNYIFLPENEINPERMVKKGSAFTGYSKAPVILRAVAILSQSVMKVGEYKDLTYEEAAQTALDIYNLPIEMFKFSTIIKREISEYKGSAAIYTMIDGLAPELKEDLGQLQSAVATWLDSNNKDGIKKRYQTLIKHARNMGSLWGMIDIIAEDMTEANKGSHFVVDILNRRLASGKTANVDDIVEYYLTRGTCKYSTPDEINGIADINIDAYIKYINRIINSFEHADITIDEFNIF